MSLLLKPDLPVDRLHLVTAAVALAGAAACDQVAGLRPGLKWPNDLLLPEGKVAGVLAETALPAVVVGIGINVRWAPPGAACLGPEVEREEVLAALLDHLDRLNGDWSAVASKYRGACVTIGQAVRVELADETFTGTALDVSDDGHLLVDVGTCMRTVAAGDVFHLRAL